MKTILLGLLVILANIGYSQHGHSNQDDFISEKISQTASFIVNADIKKVFPLFGAFEERKWAPHWEPILIHPDQEIIEEGTTFKVDASNGHGPESEFLWIVSKYEPELFLIQYLVSTPNRFWTITVHCKTTETAQTKATVTYSYIGLNEKGNELNQKNLVSMYEQGLQDWAAAINGYLSKI